MSDKKIVFTRKEMLSLNIDILKKRGVSVESIAEIAYHQQKRYSPDVTFELCVESVEKLLSLRDIFHHVQLAAEIDRLAEIGAFEGPIQDIIFEDLGLFGVDEVLGLDVAGTYGTRPCLALPNPLRRLRVSSERGSLTGPAGDHHPPCWCC